MNSLMKLAAVVLVVVSIAAAGQVSGAPAKAAPAPVALSAQEEEAVALVNADRQAAGLPPLKVSPVLVSLARDYAEDMIARDFIGHYNPEGESPFDRMRRYGVTYSYAGENLAAHRSVVEAERLLMASESHRENILSPHYSEVGIGVRPGPHGTVYVVQEFVGR